MVFAGILAAAFAPDLADVLGAGFTAAAVFWGGALEGAGFTVDFAGFAVFDNAACLAARRAARLSARLEICLREALGAGLTGALLFAEGFAGTADFFCVATSFADGAGFATVLAAFFFVLMVCSV